MLEFEPQLLLTGCVTLGRLLNLRAFWARFLINLGFSSTKLVIQMAEDYFEDEI